MHALLFLVLAAAPTPLSTVIRNADTIVVGTVVTTNASTGIVTLEIEQVLRGSAGPTLEAALTHSFIGERGLLFLGSRIAPVWLGARSKQPDRLFFSKAAVAIDSPKLQQKENSISMAALFNALGKPVVTLKPIDGVRFMKRTCPTCSLDTEIAEATASFKDLIHCDVRGEEERCVAGAWGTSRPVVAVQQVQGIDSELRQALVGRPPQVWLLRYDSDVTGGRGGRCGVAVFKTKCTDVKWTNGFFRCDGANDPSSCNAWGHRIETLGPLRPRASVKCGVNARCPELSDTASALVCLEDAGETNCRDQ